MNPMMLNNNEKRSGRSKPQHVNQQREDELRLQATIWMTQKQFHAEQKVQMHVIPFIGNTRKVNFQWQKACQWLSGAWVMWL